MAKGGSNTETVKQDPWKAQQPYLTAGFEGAANEVLNQPYGSVVPFSPESQYALEQTGNRALQGSPLIGQGQQQISNTLGGDYMSGGPGFDAFADAAWSSVRPGVDSQFARGGRTGGAAHGEALGRGFGRAMAPLYDAERGRQMQAAFGAPGMAMADYQDMGMLGQVGAQREAKAQQYASEPANRLSQYMGLVGGQGYGGQTTTSGGSGYNPYMGALGGGLLGSALPFAGPWGAIGGGLLGAFGG